MSNHWRFWSEGVVIAGLMLCWSGAAASPSGGASRAAAGAAANTALNKNIGKHKSPTSLDDPLGLVRPADLPEESAFKAFQFVSPGIMSKKIELGEVFLQKYQVSRLSRSGVFRTAQRVSCDQSGAKDGGCGRKGPGDEPQ